MEYITCPYCKQEFEYQGDGVDNNQFFEEECPECEKSFMVQAEYSVDFYSHKAPCLNGGDHLWEAICGVPKEFFKDKYRCKWCKEEKKFSEKPKDVKE